jgi:hypothetical protein
LHSLAEEHSLAPYSSITSRNALRFLFLTNHRLAFSPHIFPDGNALRFPYRTYKIRKPKTRNALCFRRLTLVVVVVVVVVFIMPGRTDLIGPVAMLSYSHIPRFSPILHKRKPYCSSCSYFSSPICLALLNRPA